MVQFSIKTYSDKIKLLVSFYTICLYCYFNEISITWIDLSLQCSSKQRGNNNITNYFQSEDGNSYKYS